MEIMTIEIKKNVDATIVEEPVAKGICSQYSNLSYVVLSDGFDVAKEDKVVSIGVRKGYDLTEEINEVLKNVLTESVRVQLMEEAIANAPAE
jgi:putative lysine transport system substrate-binding protein